MAFAVVFGVMFVKGSVRIDLRKFFRVTAVVLFFVAAQLLISGFHELSETGFLPPSKREMSVIGPIVRNDFFFPVTMLALVALMILLEYRRRKPQAGGCRHQQSRRAQAGMDGPPRTPLGRFGLHHSFHLYLLWLRQSSFMPRSQPASPATEVTFNADGKAVISTKDLPQGELRVLQRHVKGTKVRFLLYRKPDGKVASVFDACQICGGVGFYKGTNWNHLQELRCPGESAERGPARRLQSHSFTIGSGWRFCYHFHHGPGPASWAILKIMFLRLLFESFRRQKRRKTVALLAIALGMSIATAMIAVGTDIGDKINQELRSLGANLVLTPVEDTLDVNIGGVNLKPASEGAFIREQDLIKIKGIFWGHNIKGYAPFLSAPQAIKAKNTQINADLIGTYFAQPLHYGKEEFTTGVRSVNPWWKVEGEWPQDYADWPQNQPPDVLVGSKLAEQNGLTIGDAD